MNNRNEKEQAATGGTSQTVRAFEDSFRRRATVRSQDGQKPEAHNVQVVTILNVRLISINNNASITQIARLNFPLYDSKRHQWTAPREKLFVKQHPQP